MDATSRVQNLNEAVCISHNGNTLGICPPAMSLPTILRNHSQGNGLGYDRRGKKTLLIMTLIVEYTVLFDLIMATGLERENSEFKPIRLCLKLDLLSSHACT